MDKKILYDLFHPLIRFTLKRIWIASAGLAGLLFTMLTFFLVRGSSNEVGTPIFVSYALIATLSIIAFFSYKYSTGEQSSVQLKSRQFDAITYVMQAINTKKTSIQNTLRHSDAVNTRENYGFQTSSLSELT